MASPSVCSDWTHTLHRLFIITLLTILYTLSMLTTTEWPALQARSPSGLAQRTAIFTCLIWLPLATLVLLPFMTRFYSGTELIVMVGTFSVSWVCKKKVVRTWTKVLKKIGVPLENNFQFTVTTLQEA